MKSRQLLLFAALLAGHGLWAQAIHEWKEATSNGYTYKYVSNDPINTRFYTLKNGLTVILSPNTKEPRIAVRIAVRTGSNNDPKDHTGLAHYLEHLLFKGTEKYGSLDWAKEKPYLDQIDELYERYNFTTDVAKRKTIYHEIDSVSGLASRYAIANEYDKLMVSVGSQHTNAHTWVEETVYEEDVPSNATDKFLAIQAERFRNPIFRLFHTELEAVYEEKNRGLDNDNWKIQEAMHALLFPTHNYGQQTTLGTIEHLKNPSIKAIRNYYHQYYVPNNMAIVLAGDFNPDEVIKKIDADFSYMKEQPVKEYVGPKEVPIKGPVVKDIFGPSAETVRLAYRVGPAASREAMLADLVSSILSNSKAGLLDLNLNKQQKVLSASATTRQYKDYGLFILSANPKQGQTLEEAKDLLLQQIDILKKGDFDEGLVKAIVANSKLEELKGLDNNGNRVEELVDEYIKNKGKDWNKHVSELDEMKKVTKKEIVAFANRFFVNNYVVIYKRKGEDKNIVKVDKPPITPVETNAGKMSPFVKTIVDAPLTPIKPVWVDFSKDLQKGTAGKAAVLYVANKENSLFRLYYHYNLGIWNNKILPIALQYLQFLGTNNNSSEDISKQFYNLACSFYVNTGVDETNVSLNGLQENFDKAVTLLDQLISNCKPDEVALAELKSRLLKARANNKLNKQSIAAGLRSYAMFGARNPFNNVLSDDEINNLKAEDLVSLLHSLSNYEHSILYYGPESLPGLSAKITQLHAMPAAWTEAPVAQQFPRVMQDKSQTLFAEYDAVQAEVYWVKNLDAYSPGKEAIVNLFNGYFGAGMGSVVNQTIRESKALAYSTFAFVQTPTKQEDPFSFIGYVGSQADKMSDAINGMNELINKLPEVEDNFVNARQSLLKDLETVRVTKEAIIFSYLAAQKKGLADDNRQEVYAQLGQLTMADLVKYHDAELANKPYAYILVASEKKIKLDDLKKFGEVKKLELKDIFGY